jgi:hypothetical protein
MPGFPSNQNERFECVQDLFRLFYRIPGLDSGYRTRTVIDRLVPFPPHPFKPFCIIPRQEFRTEPHNGDMLV